MTMGAPRSLIASSANYTALVVEEDEDDQQAIFVQVIHDRDDDQHQPYPIPIGAWRDGYCDCLRHGCCHSLLCLSCWCLPIALGQVMTRLQLSWLGQPRRRRQEERCSSAFGIILLLSCLCLAQNYLISAFLLPFFSSRGTDARILHGIAMFRSVMCFVYGLYIVIMIARTRLFMRQAFDIPELYCCGGVEDVCCSLWCPCLTVTQMARHTADYTLYRATCCSPTGLPERAPQVIV